MNNAGNITWLLNDNIRNPFLQAFEPTAMVKLL